MNAQQRVLLQMLKELHEMCTEHDITYSICGGTLIGAVRNGGFLPWDDDADIYMTYDQWEKFKKVYKEFLPENRYLGSADLDETYTHVVPRYIATDNTLIHTAQSIHDCPAGEVIDIFVLDPVADGWEAYEKYLADLGLYTSVVNYANAFGGRLGADPDRFRELMELDKTKGRSYVTKLMEKQLASNFSEDGEWCILRWQGVPVRFKRSWWDDVVPVEFEGITLNAPSGWQSLLTYYFGHHWPEIPEGISAGKHTAASSYLFPYTEALEYYKPKVPCEKLYQDTVQRRSLALDLAKETNALSEELMQMQTSVAQWELNQQVSARQQEFDAALAEKNGYVLADILSDYLTWQLDALTIGRHFTKPFYRYVHPAMPEMDSSVFEGVLYALMAKDKMHNAVRLMTIWELKGRALTPAMEELRADINQFERAMDAFMTKDYAGCAGLLKDLRQKWPNMPRFKKVLCAALNYLWQTARTDEALAEYQAFTEKCREEFPFDGFYLKEQADYLWCTGQAQEATEQYLIAAESTRDGLALYDIAKKIGYHPAWMRNSAWGKAAQIPQWDGPTPASLAQSNAVKQAEEKLVGDRYQQKLLQLLSEIADTCEQHKIPYVLAPVAADAIFKKHVLPNSANGFALWCMPKDALRLVELLGKNLPENRALGYMGSDASLCDRVICYHDTTTLYLNMDAPRPGAMNSMHVEIWPLEPKSYSGSVSKLLKVGRKLRDIRRNRDVKSWCSKDAGASSLLGGMLFRRALNAASGAKKLTAMNGGKRVAVDKKLIANTRMESYAGVTFRVPEQLEGYVKTYGLKAIGPAMKRSEPVLCSEKMSFADFAKLGVCQSDYFSRKIETRGLSSQVKELHKDFTYNFLQIRAAVALKEVAVTLLPQKERIMSLHAEGDMDALASLFNAYVTCSVTFKDAVNMNFDDELYAILGDVRKYLKK